MSRILLARHVAAAGLILLCAAVPQATAVVIATGDGSGNTTALADNPGWADMARLSNASAVYLGNRWMITAAHVTGNDVGNSAVTFTDGRVFNSLAGTDHLLSNPSSVPVGTLPFADLTMFRLATDPGLPALPIATASPGAGADVIMIGAGKNREPNLVGWSVSSSSAWTQTPLPSANARGFFEDPNSSQMRWGANTVNSGGDAITRGDTTHTDTITFNTTFRSTHPFSAQAASGDSGGGVFQFSNGSWQLAGIMDATNSTISNQPPNTAVFGNSQTLSADLAQYSKEIQGLLSGPAASSIAPTSTSPTSLAQSSVEPSLWQNPVNRFDVARSGSADARDVLLLIDRLQNGGARPLSGAPTPSDPLLDVNGDGRFNLLDLSQLINALLNNTANPTAMATTSAMNVPEPSTGVLATLGILLAALARRFTIVRRKCWLRM